MRTTVRSPAGAVPPNAVSSSTVPPPIHPPWCRGPVQQVADPGTTLTPLYGEALARHPSIIPPTLTRLGLIAYVTPMVHTILDDLGADSHDVMDVVVDLESVFN